MYKLQEEHCVHKQHGNSYHPILLLQTNANYQVTKTSGVLMQLNV